MEQTLGDKPGLDVTGIGSHLAPDRLAVAWASMVHELVSGAAGYRSHCTHPEVIAVHPHRMNCLFERHLDFETHPIEADDVQGQEAQVGGEKNPAAPVRMDHGHEAHEATHRSPNQIHAAIAQRDAFFAIDGSYGLWDRVSVDFIGV